MKQHMVHSFHEKPRRHSAWTVQTVAVLFVLIFIVVQLAALKGHEHTVVAVARLELRQKHVPEPGTRSGQAAATTATQHQQSQQQQQQQQALQQPQPQQSGQQQTQQGPTTTSSQASIDLEDAYVPARYRQRLQQLEAGPNGEELLSSMYAPLRISHCSSHMPKHWAPCVRIPGVDIEYAEEVVYPPFMIRLPGFVERSHRETWLQMAAKRSWTPESEASVHADDYQLVPFHPHGQNFVIRNTRYTGNPVPHTWSSANTHCLGYNAELAQFTSGKPLPGDAQVDELFLNQGPQSNYFQHYLDHSPKVFIQGMHLLTNTTTVLGSPPTGRDVTALTEMWHWLMEGVNIPYSNLQRTSYSAAFAKRLIHSCRCPFIHPYHLQHWREMAVGPGAGDVPMDQRKVVLYFSRSKADAKTTNGGRRVLNENDLLPAIRSLLERRGQGEQLVVFDHSNFSTYRQLATYLNTQVRAMIGPHGGAMMNVQFASKDTLVVEFQHYGHINEMVWENAAPLRVNYWCIMYPVVTGTDINVKVDEVVQVLGEQLGKVYPLNHFVSPHSQWKKALVEGQQQPGSTSSRQV